MIKFCTLYSSSSGNSTLLSDGDTNILIDAGVSAAKITAALSNLNISPDEIDGILVTHEHTDHICGIRVLSKKFNIPVYANPKTMEHILKSAPEIAPGNARIITASKPFVIRSVTAKAFPTPHDSAESVGYVICAEGKKYAVATDTGHITKSMLSNLAGCEAVLIESNHDEEMLRSGPYPYVLKKRILSDNGHLSNAKCAWLSTQLAIWGTRRIALGHLSEQNNTYQKAFFASEEMLTANNFKVGSDVLLKVALKDEICII